MKSTVSSRAKAPSNKEVKIKSADVVKKNEKDKKK
jgi:hypothetical protein